MINPHLAPYKDCHKGLTGIIFGTGISLDRYKPLEEEKDAILFGLNRAVLHPYLESRLDYSFFGDPDPVLDPILKAKKVKRMKFGHCAKVLQSNDENTTFYLYDPHINFNNDLPNTELTNHSICFPALQIALYMGITKIFIVGCDATYRYGSWGIEGLEYNMPTVNHCETIMEHWWKVFREYSQEVYPDVEIIVVNSVLLHKWGFKSIESLI